VKRLKQTYYIEAPIAKVWRALVDPDIIEKWGAGEVKMDANPGTKFSLWNGDIHGKNLEAIENQKLVQEWFAKDWPEPSKVTILLNYDGDRTRIDLFHENIPDDEYKSIKDGWGQYYFGAIQKLLEGDEN